MSIWLGVDLVIAITRLVGAARRGLHPVLARPPQRTRRLRSRVLHRRLEWILVPRRRPRARPQPHRRDGGPRRRCRGRRTRPRLPSSRSPSTRPTRPSRISTRPRSRSRTWRLEFHSGMLIVAVSTTATIGALTIDLAHYLDFLYLLGSCFVPLFGVLLADWLVAGMRWPSPRRLLRRAGLPTRPDRRLGRRICPLPVAPAGRTGLVNRPRWRTRIRRMVVDGASLPSFALAFLLAGLAGLVRRPVARTAH